MRKILSLLLIFTMLGSSSILSGCQALAFPAVKAVEATARPTPSLTLTPCMAGNGAVEAECGYLRVPEDRSQPNGRMLDLKIVVVRAYGPAAERQADPLFYIVGGPGLPVTRADIVDYSHNYIFYQVNARRDLVFLDQRGTNDKHRLACKWPDTAIIDLPQQQMNDWMKQCLAGLEGDPRFYTTVPALQDIDDARAALGYDKINIYGISYGAAAVQVYMRMFPEHFRAGIIDHGTALDLPFFPAFAHSSQKALDQVFTYCDQDEQCHAAYPNIRDDFQALMNRLKKGPVATSYIPPGETQPASVDLLGMEEVVHETMYNGEYGKMPFYIHALATSEDWTPFVNQDSGAQQVDNSGDRGVLLFMKHMIFCFEPAWGYDMDINEIARRSAGSYYQELEVRSAEVQQKICSALPKPAPAQIYGPGKPAPLSALILSSLLDPQNPPSNDDLILKEFTKSRVVVEPLVGHNPSVQDQCRWDIIAQYIEQGSVDGLDTSCMKEKQPSFMTGN